MHSDRHILNLKAAVVIILMMTAFQTTSYAQKNSLGSSWSFSGIGITYERNVSDETFAHVSVQAEMAETFLGKASHPGISASFTWNLVFAQLESRNGTPVRFYAGPGFAAGISKDMDAPPGLFIGLKGRVGLQCLFERRINVSVSLSPILGIYMTPKDESILTRAYRHGLLQTILPEIGISYSF